MYLFHIITRFIYIYSVFVHLRSQLTLFYDIPVFVFIAIYGVSNVPMMCRVPNVSCVASQLSSSLHSQSTNISCSKCVMIFYWQVGRNYQTYEARNRWEALQTFHRRAAISHNSGSRRCCRYFGRQVEKSVFVVAGFRRLVDLPVQSFDRLLEPSYPIQYLGGLLLKLLFEVGAQLAFINVAALAGLGALADNAALAGLVEFE